MTEQEKQEWEKIRLAQAAQEYEQKMREIERNDRLTAQQKAEARQAAQDNYQKERDRISDARQDKQESENKRRYDQDFAESKRRYNQDLQIKQLEQPFIGRTISGQPNYVSKVEYDLFMQKRELDDLEKARKLVEQQERETQPGYTNPYGSKTVIPTNLLSAAAKFKQLRGAASGKQSTTL